MQPELRPLAKRVSLRQETVGERTVHRGTIGDVELVATITTMGTTAATEATEFVLDHLDVDHVAIIGIAGGLGADVHIGDLLIPDTVVNYDTRSEHHPVALGRNVAEGRLMTSGELILDYDLLNRFASEGAAAIDMETAAVGAVCEPRQVPWSVFRGISDHIRDGLVDNAVSGLAKPDGSANLTAAAKYIASNPLRLRKLAKLGRDMNTAAVAAATAFVRSLS